MSNIIFAWNINGPLSTSNKWGIIVFVSALVSLLILFGMLIIYKSIIKKAYDAERRLEQIAKSPIFNRIKRLEFISLNNPKDEELKKALELWKMTFHVQIFVELPKWTKVVEAVFADTKNRTPLISNLLKINDAYKAIRLVQTNIIIMYNETDKILNFEKFQRNSKVLTRIQLDKIFNAANEVIKNEKFSFNSEIMEKRIEELNEVYRRIDICIEKGNVQLTARYSKTLIEEAKLLILIVDAFYRMDSDVNILLADKINLITDESRKHIVKPEASYINEDRLKTLKKIFIKIQKEILDNLASLKYKEVLLKINSINSMVFDFENEMNTERQISLFLEKNLMEIKGLFNQFYKDSSLINGLIEYNVDMGIDVTKARFAYNDLEPKISSFKQNVQPFFNHIDKVNSRNEKLDFYSINDSLKFHLELLLSLYQETHAIIATLKTEKNVLEQLETDLSSIRKVLSPVEATISKNSHNTELLQFDTRIQLIYDRINAIDLKTDSKTKMLDPKNYEKSQAFLKGQLEEAIKIKREVFNKILLEKLCQEAIIYLNRFATNGGNIENEISAAIDEYNKRNIRVALNMSINLLQQYNQEK